MNHYPNNAILNLDLSQEFENPADVLFFSQHAMRNGNTIAFLLNQQTPNLTPNTVAYFLHDKFPAIVTGTDLTAENLRSICINGYTPLSYAVNRNRLNVVRYLLQNHASDLDYELEFTGKVVNGQKIGPAILHLYERSTPAEQVDMLNLLIEYNDAPEHINGKKYMDDGYTPVILYGARKVTVLEFFLRNYPESIDLYERKNIFQENCFMRDALHYDGQVVNYLIAETNFLEDFDLQTTYDNGDTVFSKILGKVDDTNLRVVLQKIGPRKISQKGWWDNVFLARMISNYFYNTDAALCRQPNGNTPLMTLVNDGFQTRVKYILENYAEHLDLDARCYFGFTFFMLICGKGYTDLVRYVLENHPHKININDKNCNNESALDIAARAGHTEITALISNHLENQERSLRL